MSDIQYCVRGCVRLRRHLRDCDGDDVCRGCEPRLADHGNLCWPCHRRLELMLTQAEIVERWLTGNLPSGQGASRAKEDYERTGGSDGSPAPLKVAVFDCRRLIADSLAEYVDEFCEINSLHGPDAHTIVADSRYLLAALHQVERLAFVGDWFEHLGELFSEAHAIAPWRPEAKRQNGVPCPECEECALVVFGGEEDVACLRCRTIMTPTQFNLWKLALKAETTEAVAG
jgi:hypothetical protein